VLTSGLTDGDMHVLLPRPKWITARELPEMNPQFALTDLALIVGACDTYAFMRPGRRMVTGFIVVHAEEPNRVR
jgi:hypothetical protein